MRVRIYDAAADAVVAAAAAAVSLFSAFSCQRHYREATRTGRSPTLPGGESVRIPIDNETQPESMLKC